MLITDDGGTGDEPAPTGELMIRVADLARIDNLAPGDTIVYRPQRDLSDAEHAELAAEWERRLPGEMLHVRDLRRQAP